MRDYTKLISHVEGDCPVPLPAYDFRQNGGEVTLIAPAGHESVARLWFCAKYPDQRVTRWRFEEIANGDKEIV